jgi:hypothetical protein
MIIAGLAGALPGIVQAVEPWRHRHVGLELDDLPDCDPVTHPKGCAERGRP